MSKTGFKRLGDYIREVDVRNRDLKVTKLMGINIGKYFMPSVANVIGTDLSNYKIVAKNQFACNLMHVGRDEKIPMAMLENTESVIVSPAYFVFQISQLESLLPEYLMMWFRNPHFDKEAWFYTDSDVRGGMAKSALLDMNLPIPPIDQQRKIVAKYNAIQQRIKLNEQLIVKLEETAQAIYRKMFVDGIDKNNLPEGWKLGTIKDFCKEITSGGTPSRTHNEYWNSKDYRWLKTGEVQNNIVLDTEEYISAEGLRNSSAKIIPSDTITMAMYGGGTVSNIAYLNCETTTNQACCNMICNNKTDAVYLYFHLRYKQNEIKRLANGGAQENLSQELISQQPIYILKDNKYKIPFVGILNQMIIKTKENNKLTKLQSLLLAKMESKI